MKGLLFAASGAIFGFVLHQAQVTDYDKIVGMFLLKDLHLMGVMGAAIAVSAAGLFVLRRTGARAVAGGEIEVKPKPMRRGILVAGALFGLGWALSGTWPGTALAQVGEGKITALATVAGLLAGTFAYGLRPPKPWPVDTPRRNP